MPKGMPKSGMNKGWFRKGENYNKFGEEKVKLIHKKISESLKNKKFTKEHKENLKKNHWSKRGFKHPMQGKKRPDMVKRMKNNKYFLGRKHMHETIVKMKNSD